MISLNDEQLVLLAALLHSIEQNTVKVKTNRYVAEKAHYPKARYESDFISKNQVVLSQGEFQNLCDINRTLQAKIFGKAA